MIRSVILLLVICASSLSLATGQPGHTILKTKQIAKAEKLLSKLARLQQFTQSGFTYAAYKEAVHKLSNSVLEDVADLPEGNVKTDIGTSFRFYESALREWSVASASRPAVTGCEEERAGSYRTLCESVKGNRLELAWSKASLHARWANAVLSKEKGSGDADTEVAISEMLAERRIDHLLAERCVGALKLLSKEVVAYNSLAEFEEGRTVSRLPFEKLGALLENVGLTVSSDLDSLPESRLKNEIHNALRSYLDGGFRWTKSYRPAVVTLASLAYMGEQQPSRNNLDAAIINYTVTVNWKHALRYTERAEELLSISVEG
jgi:hypothetical protein